MTEDRVGGIDQVLHGLAGRDPLRVDCESYGNGAPTGSAPPATPVP